MQNYPRTCLIGLQVEIPVGQLHVSCRSGKNSVGPANAVSLQDPCPAEEKSFRNHCICDLSARNQSYVAILTCGV